MLIVLSNADKISDAVDSPVTQQGGNLAIEVIKSLVQLYGNPECIVLSPYTQTRQTLDFVTTALPAKVSVFVDDDLSLFLTPFRGKCELKFKPLPFTLSYNPPLDESYKSFRYRVRRVFDHYVEQKDKNVWFITHPDVMREISSLLDKECPEEITIETPIISGCGSCEYPGKEDCEDSTSESCPPESSSCSDEKPPCRKYKGSDCFAKKKKCHKKDKKCKSKGNCDCCQKQYVPHEDNSWIDAL